MRYIVIENMVEYLNGEIPVEALRCRAVATLAEAHEAGLRLAQQFYQLSEDEASDELAREFYSEEGSQGVALVFDGSSRTTFPTPYNGEDDLESDLPPVVLITTG